MTDGCRPSAPPSLAPRRDKLVPLRALLLAGLLVGTLGGCARYYWTRPDGTAQQFDRDSRECVQEAKGKTTPGAISGLALGAIEQMYRYCLTTRGYARDKQYGPPPTASYRGFEDDEEFVAAVQSKP